MAVLPGEAGNDRLTVNPCQGAFTLDGGVGDDPLVIPSTTSSRLDVAALGGAGPDGFKVDLSCAGIGKADCGGARVDAGARNDRISAFGGLGQDTVIIGAGDYAICQAGPDATRSTFTVLSPSPQIAVTALSGAKAGAWAS